MTRLYAHPERGWLVDSEAGEVYGVAGRWVGKSLGRVGSHGYRVTTINGKAYLLHRVVWEACVGPIPPGMWVDHINGVKTDNRLSNLEPVTPGENNRRAYATGLKVYIPRRGEDHHCYKVTPAMRSQVLARLSSGETGVSIAADVGVSPKTISRIKRGERR